MAIAKRRATPPNEAPEKEKAPGRKVLEAIRSVATALVVALAIRAFLFEPYSIPSGSMLPTLQIGDYVVVTKFAYGVRMPFTNSMIWQRGLPERGDVIVFERPTTTPETLIKRVVGVGGDEVRIVDGVVWINGEAQERRLLEESHTFDDYLEMSRAWVRASADLFVESFEEPGRERHLVLHAKRLRRDSEGPFRVPEGHVLVLGDNRDNSTDSRAFGFVPVGNIRGRADLIGFSWGKSGPRMDRIFRGIDASVPEG